MQYRRHVGSHAAATGALPRRASGHRPRAAQELPSDAVLEALRRGVADVGIVADYVETAGLSAQAWVDDELVAPAAATRRRQRSKRYGSRSCWIGHSWVFLAKAGSADSCSSRPPEAGECRTTECA
jgi:DNA-binding transcriptional LysR family regulator